MLANSKTIIYFRDESVIFKVLSIISNNSIPCYIKAEVFEIVEFLSKSNMSILEKPLILIGLLNALKITI
jgi:hypothetical protein